MRRHRDHRWRCSSDSLGLAVGGRVAQIAVIAAAVLAGVFLLYLLLQ